MVETVRRLLVVSPFAAHQTRATQQTADLRNALVASLAVEVFLAHAAPGGKVADLD